MEDTTGGARGGEVKLQIKMKDTGPKTVFSSQNFSGDLVTIYAGQTKRAAENTMIRRTLPGKSSISRIILHDNTSQERLLDMKISDIKTSQRKMDAFMLNQKNTFLKRMEKKQTNWAKEHTRQATDFNNQGSKSLDGMLEMMLVDTERMGVGGGGPTEMEGDGVVDNGDDEKKLPVVNERAYAAEMSKARIPERKLIHRTTGIPSLPTLFSLPSHIEQKGTHNPFLTSDNDAQEEDQVPDHPPKLKKTNTSVSITRQSKDIGLTLPGVSRRKKTSIVSNFSIRSHTAPKETSKTSAISLPIVTQSSTRPITDPPVNLYPSYGKKTKHHSQVLRLPGPEPTFISESLPMINTSDPHVVRLHTQRQNRKARNARRRARAREANKATTNSSENPLADERFMNLQKFLSPKLSEHETRDMAALTRGIAAAKRLARKHFDVNINDVISEDEDKP